MALKNYQQRVLQDTEVFLRALRAGQLNHSDDAIGLAWKTVTGKSNYQNRSCGSGDPLPNFCLKVPTGGGKTLLATQVIAQVWKILLPERSGAGLVLWVVPSDQIYKDTIKALRDRHHFYRQSLDIALSRRVEVWEKENIRNITPAQLADNLNILILKLQGTNRQDREGLKFFRDTAGNIVRHFPAENDYDAHRVLKERCSNLEMLLEDEAFGCHQTKTSIANFVRLQKPLVIIDEGHKATSQLAQETIAGFNPSLVIELSATPVVNRNHDYSSNVLSEVSGKDLLAEDMIKLPINIKTDTGGAWQQCLTQAHTRRLDLEQKARKHSEQGGRPIRPIVLVQVQRTGNDQRTPGYIHAEDAREYLVQTLGVSPEKVCVKSSSRDDLEGVDLMSVDCPVEWIITKSALQEGWDCPNAYILVSLNNTQSLTSMTQLVGRVLRQPYTEKTPFSDLNESYVYCLYPRPLEVVQKVRKALDNEGYQGMIDSVRDSSAPNSSICRKTKLREEVLPLYWAPPPPPTGDIELPTLAIAAESLPENDAEAAAIPSRRFDYHEDLLQFVSVREFEYSKFAAQWDWQSDIEESREYFYRVHLHDPADALAPLSQHQRYDFVESDEAAKAWLAASLQIEGLGAKSIRRLISEACEAIPLRRGKSIKDQLSLARFPLLERLRIFAERERDIKTQEQWDRLHAQRKLLFRPDDSYVKTTDGKIVYSAENMQRVNQRVPHQREIENPRPLFRSDGSPLQRSLFDIEQDDLNPDEREVAREIDTNGPTLWWLRNDLKTVRYNVQGYKNQRVYPDFVLTQLNTETILGQGQESLPLMILFESKGKHLAGNEDTKYKNDLARRISEIGNQFTWQPLRSGGKTFSKHRLRFEVLELGQDWRDKMKTILDEEKIISKAA